MNRLDVVRGPATPRATTPKISGMLEVIGPEDGFILGACLTMSRQNCSERTDAQKDQKNGQNGRLLVFGPKEEVVIEPIQTLPRWDISAKSIKNKNSSRIPETNLRSSHYTQKNTDDKEKNSRNVEKIAVEQLSETTDDDDESSSEHSENEDGKRNAPIELLGEFLKAIMDQDYNLARKLCQMILIYEPENTEAKQFLPLLEEKLLIENTQNVGVEESDETNEGSSEDSEEDSSSSDNSDDERGESSDDSDENL